ncbi:MAG: acyl carrier protein [Alphaproteobacteria bacterium]|nr:acyl carrier protein [Alphaproteobacteria bacterium]
MNPILDQSAVVAVLREILGPERIDAAIAAADLIEEGHLDSFGLVEFAAHLEARFGLVIPPDAIGPPAFSTLVGITALCRRLKNHDGA